MFERRGVVRVQAAHANEKSYHALCSSTAARADKRSSRVSEGPANGQRSPILPSRNEHSARTSRNGRKRAGPSDRTTARVARVASPAAALRFLPTPGPNQAELVEQLGGIGRSIPGPAPLSCPSLVGLGPEPVGKSLHNPQIWGQSWPGLRKSGSNSATVGAMAARFGPTSAKLGATSINFSGVSREFQTSAKLGS